MGGKRIASWVGSVVLLNGVATTALVLINQSLLNLLGFIELPTLIAINSAMVVACYGSATVVISLFLPQRDLRKRLAVGAMLLLPLLLPLLLAGLALGRYYILDYCTSASPADPRCEAVMGYAS